MTEQQYNGLLIELREKDAPYFSKEELEYFYKKHNGNVSSMLYECLLIKAENTTLSVSGLTTTDTSKYFKMLAQKYRTSNSGNLI